MDKPRKEFQEPILWRKGKIIADVTKTMPLKRAKRINVVNNGDKVKSEYARIRLRKIAVAHTGPGKIRNKPDPRER